MSPTTRRPRRKAAGFSLIELMMVLAVAGIFAAIAFPAMTYLSHATKVKSASTNFYLSLLRARSEAVKRNSNVTLTPASSGHWETGWSLTDNSGNVIFSQGELKGVSVVSNITTNLVYLSSGRIQGVLSPTFSITHSTQGGDTTTAVARCVSVQPNGSPYVKSSAC